MKRIIQYFIQCFCKHDWKTKTTKSVENEISIVVDWRNDINITLFSNSLSYLKLDEFINLKKNDKVISFTIEHRASKKQDEIASKFIEEILHLI